MKLKNLTYGLLASAMLVSCSDDMNVNGPEGSNSGSDNLSRGYIGVTIGMPLAATTRGVNDNFDDGLEDEYKVENAAVIFFKGATEADAKFYKAYVVADNWAGFEDTPNQITQQNVATFPVDFAKEANERLWAMAVVNYGGIFTLTKGADEAAGYDVSVNGIPMNEDYSIEELMKLTTNEKFYQTEGNKKTKFFMVNTPYSRMQGGANEPFFNDGNDFRVLADVDRSKIFETEAEALRNPATEIFVERAVAKVDITANYAKLVEGLPEGVEIAKVEWLLDNTEPSSYIVRNLESVAGGYGINDTPEWAKYTSEFINAPYYRFIGQARLKDLAKYRTYFCADPNGDGLAVNGGVELTRTAAGNNPQFQTIESGVTSAPQYCHENTFSVANMNTFNTTCAVIKVTYKTKDTDNETPTFYTIGLNNKVQFTYENAARVLAVDVIYNPAVKAALEEFYKDVPTYDANISTSNLDYKTPMQASNEWMTIVFEHANGRLLIKSLTLKDGLNNTDTTIKEFTAATDKAVIDALNAVQEVKAHVGGVSYYSVLIKHFGDDYTPWDAARLGINETTDDTTDSYTKFPNYNQNFLGRYGVVRNNWYSINIARINNFGEPTFGDLHFDKTPDDKFEKEESIACQINILSWAKRQQNAEL